MTPADRARAARTATRTLAAAGVLRLALWATVFAGLLGYARLFRHTYIDDAYITLQYARNLAEHGAWEFLPGVTANTATSPLNVLLLALTDRLHPGSTVDAVAWLGAAEWAATLAVLLRLSRRLTNGPYAGLLAFAGLVTNPLLLSAIGLEGYLYALLMLAAVLCSVDRRTWLLGAALGLLTLARPDGALMTMLLLGLAPIGWRARGRAVLGFLAPTLPWYLYSWVHLGSLVPDTLIIKLNQSAWGRTTVADGFALYRDRYGSATAASIAMAALIPFALPALWRMDSLGRRAIGALAVYGVLHFAVYVAMGVPPFHWYYTHEIVPIVVLGGLGGAELLGRLAATGRPGRWTAFAATAAPALGMVYLVATGWRADVAPIATNWATPDRYREIGLALHTLVGPDQVTELRGEIGTIAYYCECRVVDGFADPARTDELVADLRATASAPVSLLLDLNFLWRSPARPLPPATRLLEFDPIDPGESLPPPGRDVLASWTASSPWVPLTQITLRGRSVLTIEVRLLDANGVPLPPERQPAMSGDYLVFTVAGGPENGEIARGRWQANNIGAVSVPPFTDLTVRVSARGYGTADATIVVTGIGTGGVTVWIAPAAGPP